MRPVLLLEINEVPLRVWEKYAADGRFTSVSRLVTESRKIETRISDSGELSPWCTWPTVHRGISKKEHGIHNLGQDPATFRGVPIWDEYRSRGKSIGVFGSMQSWPAKDPGPGGFYVPDTFATDARCIPAYIEPVQAFNLLQVRENARVMAEKAMTRPPAFGLLLAMFHSGVSLGTMFRIAKQLIGERVNPRLRESRVSFQALLFWDIFRAHFNPTSPPAFTTFFTNHIASVMHRFWNHIFPDDFPESAKPPEKHHKDTMDFAMGTLDGILRDAFVWRSLNPELLVLVANSMGQAAVIRKDHQGFELLLREPIKLLALVSPGESATQNLAMMPQVSLELKSEATASAVAAKINSIRLPSGLSFLKADVRGATLSISCHTHPAKELESGKFQFEGSDIPFSAAGIERVNVDPGTGYHVPEGLIFALGLPAGVAMPKKIDATEVKALILDWAGLPR